jgi:hypothetical protein
MKPSAVLTTLCHNSPPVIVCPKQQCTAHSRRFVLGVLRAGLFLNICYCVSVPVLVAMPPTGVNVQGPGVPPNLGFACCDQGIEEMQALFNNQDVIADLKDLHAEVAIPILDFSPERAAAVHRLNQAGIPVIAWVLLGKEQGLFLNVDNASEAAERIKRLEKWSSENGLKWTTIGLDIEPNFNDFANLKTHRLRLVARLVHRSFDGTRVSRARHEYSELIDQIRSRGFPVQTYVMPYIPAERSVHSTLLDRMLGTVDVRGDVEYLMLYTSSARAVGAGMIWSIGRNAQAIAIGSTDGDSAPGSGVGPLNWQEFSRDLIVASHYSKYIGVYNLEGCVRQGFLPRLKTIDWSQSVTIPEQSIRRARRLGLVLRAVLWIGSNLLYIAIVLIFTVSWMVWRWCRRRTKKPIVKRPQPGWQIRPPHG